MPVISTIGPPYDPVEVVLNFARVIANDCQITLDGNLLADTQPYTFILLNLSWRKLQDRLGNNNMESFPAEVMLTNIPPMNQTVWTDPGSQAYIDYVNYYDGVDLQPGPQLPQDMEIPLKLWERPSGQNAQFIPMFPANNGLPSRPKTNWYREWEWRDDKIWLVGSTQQEDFRVRYKRFIVDPLPQWDMAQSQAQPIPILRCAVALAYYTVETFSVARGGTVTPNFTAEREEAIKQLINNTTRKKQYSNFRRRPYSRRGNTRFTW